MKNFKFRSLNIIILFFFFFSILITSVKLNANSLINLDSSDVYEKIHKEAILIDIRREEEWIETGVIEESILITAFDKRGYLKPNFIKDIENILRNNENIIFMCRSGNRSKLLIDYLSNITNYENISHSKYGILGWLKLNYPLVIYKK